MSKSIWDDPRITAYVLGEMPQEERAAFEIELDENGELASAVEEARTVTDQLASLYERENVPKLGQQQRAAITAQQVALPVNESSGSWLRWGLVLAIAASLLVMIGVSPRLTDPGGLTQKSSSDRAEGDTAEEAAMVDELVNAPLTQRQNAREEIESDFETAPLASSDPQRPMPAPAGEVAVRKNFSPRATEGRANDKVFDDDLADLDMEMPDAERATITGGGTSTSGLQVASGAKITDGGAGAEDAGLGDYQGRSVAESKSIKRDAQANMAGNSTPSASNAPVDSRTQPLNPEPTPSPMPGSVTGGQVTGGLVTGGLARGARADAAAPAVDAAEPSDPTAVPAQVGRSRSESASNETVKAAAAPTLQPASKSKTIVLSADREAAQKVQEALKQAENDFGAADDRGRGPGISGDRFDVITDNPFQRVADHPLSTFSVDVDTASYSKVRDFLIRSNQLPRKDAVRIEELINYFSYDYQPPNDSAEHPFAAQVQVTSCPWNGEHRLARIALQGKSMKTNERPQSNLVFLLDTSGSMNAPNKLPLVIQGMKMLIKQLNEDDRVAIAVYAGSAGLVLDSTPVGQSKKIRKALTELSAGGSTNGGAGIALAYQTARDHFLSEGVNRVILCTDGDFNVGTTGTDELVRMVEQEAKGGVFLSVLGFGMGNHNDAMLEQISGRGNGNYAFIDSEAEAHKVLVEQASGTLVTIAKDVKLQVEFNPSEVASYRLIGYENRVLAAEDFNDDKKDAGEIGAGHSVTALYEIVPAGIDADANPPKVDALKYQQPAQLSEAAGSEELLTLKLRYKQPDGDTSRLVEFPVIDQGGEFAEADDDVRFVAAVAGFGMQLRRSPYAGSWTLSDVMNTAQRAKGKDRDGRRAEFVNLVQKASQLMGQE